MKASNWARIIKIKKRRKLSLGAGVVIPLSRTPTETHRRGSLSPPRANGFFKIQFQHNFPRFHFTCNSTGGGDNNESRIILDAFFLGKAVAEAVNERVESAVGEFLSTVGRLQAEKQKQIQEFQEEVLEKGRLAKEQAAREAIEAQGLVSKSTASDITRVNNGYTSTSSSASNSVTIESSSVSKLINGDLLSGMLNDD